MQSLNKYTDLSSKVSQSIIIGSSNYWTELDFCEDNMISAKLRRWILLYFTRGMLRNHIGKLCENASETRQLELGIISTLSSRNYYVTKLGNLAFPGSLEHN
uniref:Uncharacterized protein n=1 Tax=Romanomermis culicivorax TaxID=13658 RepID=A0A915J2S0_ROMCU